MYPCLRYLVVLTPTCVLSSAQQSIVTVSAVIDPSYDFVTVSLSLFIYAGCDNQVDREVLDVISYLLQRGAKPGTLGLIRLSASTRFPDLKVCPVLRRPWCYTYYFRQNVTT